MSRFFSKTFFYTITWQALSMKTRTKQRNKKKRTSLADE